MTQIITDIDTFSNQINIVKVQIKAFCVLPQITMASL